MCTPRRLALARHFVVEAGDERDTGRKERRSDPSDLGDRKQGHDFRRQTGMGWRVGIFRTCAVSGLSTSWMKRRPIHPDCTAVMWPHNSSKWIKINKKTNFPKISSFYFRKWKLFSQSLYFVTFGTLFLCLFHSYHFFQTVYTTMQLIDFCSKSRFTETY